MALVQEKKGGPYNKNEKAKRQNEVFRLHFERGYSAVKISEMMKINRNTINSDINYWYSVLSKEWESYDVDSWCMKQIHRLESQRSRLFKELDKVQETSTVLSIEKMILDIDTRMMNFVTKTIFTQNTMMDNVTKKINECAKEKDMKIRFIESGKFLHASKETRDKIYKILKEDHEKTVGKM